MKNMYALIEDGAIHTANLSKADAEEMHERHARIFDDQDWQVVPMSETHNMEQLTGYLERFRQNAVRYHQP